MWCDAEISALLTKFKKKKYSKKMKLFIIIFFYVDWNLNVILMQSLRYTVHGIKTAFNISYLYNKSVFTFCFNNIKIIISAKSLHVITFFILNWMGKWFARPLTQTQTHTNIVTINGNNGNSFGSWERTFATFALLKMGFQCFSAVGCVHMICCCFF